MSDEIKILDALQAVVVLYNQPDAIFVSVIAYM
jgi:hypothetical protein